MIDSHCHLFESKDIQLEVEEARKSGINKILCAGAGEDETIQALKIRVDYKDVYVAAGLGYEPKNGDVETWENKLRDLVRNDGVVAVGECGLDYFEGISSELKAEQVRWFEMHIRVAKESNLPLVIHCRNAFEEVYDLLKLAQIPAQLHCFTGNNDWLNKFVDIGCYISFGGIITFKKSEELREIVKITPEDRLLLETDAPYLAPEPIRGTINQVKNVMIVAKMVAQIREKTLEEIDTITTKNALSIFNKIT